MRRIALVIALVVSVVVFATMAFAFKNEPLGFKGLEWGKKPTPDMIKIVEDYARRGYIRTSDKLALGGALLDRITYMFFLQGFREEFFAVRLEFTEERAYNILVNICKEKFGDPDKEILKELVWNGERTSIVLDYSGITQEGVMIMAHNTLTERYKAEKARQQAKEAEKDW